MTPDKDYLNDVTTRDVLKGIGAVFGLSVAGDVITGAGVVSNSGGDEFISTVEAQESYETSYEIDGIEGENIAEELESEGGKMGTAGTDLDQKLEKDPFVDYTLGFEDRKMYLDWGSAAREYRLGNAYDEAKRIADDVTQE